MARSKHHKHKKLVKPQRHSFYEALPSTMPVQPAQPDVAEIGRQAQNLLADVSARTRTSLSVIQQTLASIPPRVMPAAQAAVQYASYTAAIAKPYLRTGSQYAAAASRDLRSALRWTGRALWNRRTRAVYMAAIAVSVLVAVVVGTTIATATMALYSSDIASASALLDKKKTGTTILDRNGQVLFEGYGAQHTKIAPLAEMPASLKQATLAAEDPDFYQHPGFSWRGTARAAWVDITRGGKIEGGSTLTQQLVKSALLTSNKSFERKYQELLIATELERRYSKDQILEMYLNEVYYGQGAHGVAAASQAYFHKSPKELTLGESALLAGLPLGPSRLDPNVDHAAATGRRDYVLNRMAELKMITRTQADTAIAEPIKAYARTVTIKAPHFVFYILDQLRRQYGDEMVEQGGLTVQTTLDLTKQQGAERIIQAQIQRLASHHVTNAGLVALEPGTGDIMTMVGSVDYNAPGFGAVNVTLSQLQPGSSFKPIAYVTAFQKGWNGSTQVDDTPIQLPESDGTMYIPQNYDGKFRGKVTLRRALGNSLNIPAIKVIQHAGINETIDTAHAMGITSLNDRNRYGVSLVLGGGEVRPIDMATVYSTFANNGVKVTPRSILKVSDRYGKDITKPSTQVKQPAIDPRHAHMITSILSDNETRAEVFGANPPLKLNRPAAAKTGTTNDFRDNWTVGYTPSLVTAVWVGNNDHSAMQGVDGITGAAPIWHDFMELAHQGIAPQPFAVPNGIKPAKVCRQDGGLANSWDSGYEEVFLTDQPLTRQCNTFARAAAEPITPPADDNEPPKPEDGGFNFPKPPQITWPFQSRGNRND